MLNIDYADLVYLANADGEFNIAARYWDGRLDLVIGDDGIELLLDNGHIAGFAKPGSFGTDARRIRISAAEADWAKLLESEPPPGWHNVGTAFGFTIEGNILDRGPYYAAIRRLIELMREQVSGPTVIRAVPDVDRSHDDAIGRYIYVDIQGVQYRIYYEETGSGIPLVLQHTAGTDGRQWRHILEDRHYQRDFRMISYDLPYHGKSVPPTSVRWWAQEYVLTKTFLMDAVVAISEAIGLDRPVFMGCSIGGELAPDLAFYHPDEFRSVIGINSTLDVEHPPYTKEVDTSDQAPYSQVHSWFHPRVASDWKASSMLGNMAPTSPEAYQRETAWLYSQGAPPVFTGDAIFYLHGHDLTAEQARQIDTSRVDVYLLTGEYDPLALNGGSEKLAACISGSHFQLIPGAGHFAPSDNPEAFKAALDPVMKEIAAKYQ